MKSGEKTRCPACGETTIVKTRAVVQDWHQTGEEYYCIFCEAPLGPVPATTDTATILPESTRRDALSALLGGETLTPRAKLDDIPGERRFCRDCRHYIKHPFHSLCGLHDRETDPMADCPDFDRHATPESPR